MSELKTNPLDEHEADHARFVVYSPTLGVYLGHQNDRALWSKDDSLNITNHTLIPTFPRPEGENKIMNLSVEGVPGVQDAQLRLCYPGKGVNATTVDLTNAGINWR